MFFGQPEKRKSHEFLATLAAMALAGVAESNNRLPSNVYRSRGTQGESDKGTGIESIGEFIVQHGWRRS